MIVVRLATEVVVVLMRGERLPFRVLIEYREIHLFIALINPVDLDEWYGGPVQLRRSLTKNSRSSLNTH
jgi:hypothetical protein